MCAFVKRTAAESTTKLDIARQSTCCADDCVAYTIASTPLQYRSHIERNFGCPGRLVRD